MEYVGLLLLENRSGKNYNNTHLFINIILVLLS